MLSDKAILMKNHHAILDSFFFAKLSNYTKIPIPLKRATHKNSVNAEISVVQTTTCPASSASPFIWSAMETVATASDAANKENKAVYSAPEKAGIPRSFGTKIASPIPTTGAKTKRTGTQTQIGFR